MLLSAWRDPNVVRGEEVLVAEMDGRIVLRDRRGQGTRCRRRSNLGPMWRSKMRPPACGS